MAKLKISTDTAMNKILDKIIPCWKECFNKQTIENAQVSKSQARKYMFGKIMNEKFIKLSKASAGFKKGDIVSISDLYQEEYAQNLVGLIIYRLGSSGFKKPVIMEA